MGGKRLKIKDELNYRKGTTAHYCSECDHYVSEYEITDIAGHVRDRQPRCKIIGLKDGRSYRIHPKNICDRHDNSKSLKRIRGY